MHKAGLLARGGRGEYEATEAGRTLLRAPLERLTLGYLMQHYPGVRAFQRLTKLMVAHGAGVREDRTIVLKRLDLDYFEPDALA